MSFKCGCSVCEFVLLSRLVFLADFTRNVVDHFKYFRAVIYVKNGLDLLLVYLISASLDFVYRISFHRWTYVGLDMLFLSCHTQLTETSIVSGRTTIEQPANRPPITEQHQRDQSGTLSFLARPITEFHSRQNQLLHCDLTTNLKVRLQIALNKITNHRSAIGKATSKAKSIAYMNSTHKDDL